MQAVAARAGELAACLPPGTRDSLRSSAWLHDVGYAPDLADTGLHALDGARYLRAEGWPPVVVNAVAHHSGSRFEAAQRGLMTALAEFPVEGSPLLAALSTADLTIGPGGEPMTFDQRVDDILARYPRTDPVHRAWLAARHMLAEDVRRTHIRLAGAQPR